MYLILNKEKGHMENGDINRWISQYFLTTGSQWTKFYEEKKQGANNATQSLLHAPVSLCVFRITNIL